MKKCPPDHRIGPTAWETLRDWHTGEAKYLSEARLLNEASDDDLVTEWRAICLYELIKRRFMTKEEVKVWLVKRRLGLEV